MIVGVIHRSEVTAHMVQRAALKLGILSSGGFWQQFFFSSQPSSPSFCPWQEGSEETVDYHLQDGATTLRHQNTLPVYPAYIMHWPIMIKRGPEIATLTVQHPYFALRFPPTYQRGHNGTSHLTVASKRHQKIKTITLIT